MTPYWPLYLGLSAYAVFISACIAVGFKGNTKPIKSFCIRHAIAAPIVCIVALLLARVAGLPAWDSFTGAIFAVVYFLLAHYAVMIHPFAVAQRSVSANLLLALIRLGGTAFPSRMMEDYGKGKSLDYVTRSRLEQMLLWRWIAADDTMVRKTPRGVLRIRIAALLLGTLGLKPLASP